LLWGSPNNLLKHGNIFPQPVNLILKFVHALPEPSYLLQQISLLLCGHWGCSSDLLPQFIMASMELHYLYATFDSS